MGNGVLVFCTRPIKVKAGASSDGWPAASFRPGPVGMGCKRCPTGHGVAGGALVRPACLPSLDIPRGQRSGSPRVADLVKFRPPLLRPAGCDVWQGGGEVDVGRPGRSRGGTRATAATARCVSNSPCRSRSPYDACHGGHPDCEDLAKIPPESGCDARLVHRTAACENLLGPMSEGM